MAHILVIEDDPGISGIFKTVLENAGHKVTQAGTAEDGILRLNADPPDLLTLDINMPGGGGLIVANELHAKKLKIPFILCTASVLNAPVEAYELFMVRHLYAGSLKKPMEIEDILKMVDKGLELKEKLLKESPAT